MKKIVTASFLVLVVCSSQNLWARNTHKAKHQQQMNPQYEPQTNASPQTMQQQLNQQVLSGSFQAVDDATLSRQLEEATKRGEPTKSSVKTNYYQYWHNGYYYPYAAYRLGWW